MKPCLLCLRGTNALQTMETATQRGSDEKKEAGLKKQRLTTWQVTVKQPMFAQLEQLELRSNDTFTITRSEGR